MQLLRLGLITALCASAAVATAEERVGETESPATIAAPPSWETFEGAGVRLAYTEGVTITQRQVDAPEGPAELVELVEADHRTGVVPANPVRVTVVSFSQDVDVPGGEGSNALVAVGQLVTSIQRVLRGSETSDAIPAQLAFGDQTLEGRALTITGDDGVRTVSVLGLNRTGSGPLVLVIDTPSARGETRIQLETGVGMNSEGAGPLVMEIASQGAQSTSVERAVFATLEILD